MKWRGQNYTSEDPQSKKQSMALQEETVTADTLKPRLPVMLVTNCGCSGPDMSVGSKLIYAESRSGGGIELI